MPLLTLRNVSLAFRGPPVLDGADLVVEPGERLGLLGRNGSGKTSLLRLIQGEIEPDRGEIARQQGLRTSMLPQEVPQGLQGRVFDEVARGLGPRASVWPSIMKWPAGWLRPTAAESDELHARLDRIQHALENDGGWSMHQEVEAILSRMSLPPDADVATLSAGMKRRVLLAKALVRSPDILLLDEPTNHLDIDAIGWLEDFLLRCGKAILFVTHDRILLRKLATRILDLDRGRLTSWSCDYETYLQRKEARLEAEAQQWADFDKKLAQEEVWIRTGIQARRTRNEGRVRALESLRERPQRPPRPAGRSPHGHPRGRALGRLVIEAKHVSFAYADRPIIGDLSTTIMRGDRVGLIGPNGSGKTTLFRLLLGELRRRPARSGMARIWKWPISTSSRPIGRDEIGRATTSATAPIGRPSTASGGTSSAIWTTSSLHPSRRPAPVARLSGGERNRLLLARLFTKPSNVLVMDEPTNDLDMETLELLEDLLIDYPGTLLLVSHDREFLNNVVSSTLVLEGEGRVKEYAGGYDDWLRQRPPERRADLQCCEAQAGPAAQGVCVAIDFQGAERAGSRCRSGSRRSKVNWASCTARWPIRRSIASRRPRSCRRRPGWNCWRAKWPRRIGAGRRWRRHARGSSFRCGWPEICRVGRRAPSASLVGEPHHWFLPAPKSISDFTAEAAEERRG